MGHLQYSSTSLTLYQISSEFQAGLLVYFVNFESVQNYGLYSGDKNFFKVLKIYDTIKLIGKVKGDIIFA